MKNKGLIIGGIAVLAVGGFLFMRRRNKMAEESMVMDSKSDSPSADLPVKGSGTPISPIVGSTTSTSIVPPVVNVVPMVLTLKPINNATDLIGTRLGSDIGLTNASSVILGNVTNAIVRLGSVGREVLNYISDTNSLQRATPEFAKGLDAKVGQGASALNFAERLVTFLNRNRTAVAAFPSAPASVSFNADGMDCEGEDFAFNGHMF